MTFDLATFINQKWDWSQRTFGPGRRTQGICEHIFKELDEITLSPTELEEWVDVILLAIDGACRSGHDGQEIVDAIITKQMKNVERKWPDWKDKSQDEAIEHLKIITPYDGGDVS